MIETTLRVANSSNVGTTGLTGTEIKFRASPFGAGDVVTIDGVSGGTNGIYLCSFLTVSYQAVQLWISGVYQSTWGTKMIGNEDDYYLRRTDTSSQSMAGAIAMGSNKITGLPAASANGDATRWEQTVVIDSGATRTVAAQVLFSTHPSATPGGSTFPPTASGHYTPKWYVDDLFGTAVGVVQSTYLIKLLPGRSTEDIYSKTTAEKCYTYLSGLTDISTRFGCILVEPLAQAGNLINLDDGTSSWIGNGVFYQGVGNKPTLNRRAPGSSLTVTNGGIINCHILDNNVVSARAYTGFTFENCTFDVPDATDMAFTNCKFKGVNKFKSDGGGELTMSNCTGDIFIYNDSIGTVTITGTQPAQVISTDAGNFDF